MQITEILNIGAHVVAIASALAAMTPTNTDNKIVSAISYVLDLFAFNWGNAQNSKR